MNKEIFYWILNMSIASVLTGIIILFLEKIKKLPRRLIFILWCIPFLRLCLFAAPASKYSFMALLSHIFPRVAAVSQQTDDFTSMNYIGASESYFPIVYKTGYIENLFFILSIVWIVGTAVILIFSSAFYILAIHKLKHAVHWKDNIYLSDNIDSPAVYGVFHPKIILPCGCENKNLTFLLAHEQEHITHRDNLWRIAAFVLSAIHWFNPFVWVFLKHFLAAMELACDERVLKKAGEEKKKEYAAALLDWTESRKLFVSPFGGAKLRTRIETIISYKKYSLFSLICFADLAIAAACILLTNAL